jgi:hypothetical protein
MISRWQDASIVCEHAFVWDRDPGDLLPSWMERSIVATCAMP